MARKTCHDMNRMPRNPDGAPASQNLSSRGAGRGRNLQACDFAQPLQIDDDDPPSSIGIGLGLGERAGYESFVFKGPQPSAEAFRRSSQAGRHFGPWARQNHGIGLAPA